MVQTRTRQTTDGEEKTCNVGEEAGKAQACRDSNLLEITCCEPSNLVARPFGVFGFAEQRTGIKPGQRLRLRTNLRKSERVWPCPPTQQYDRPL